MLREGRITSRKKTNKRGCKHTFQGGTIQGRESCKNCSPLNLSAVFREGNHHSLSVARKWQLLLRTSVPKPAGIPERSHPNPLSTNGPATWRNHAQGLATLERGHPAQAGRGTASESGIDAAGSEPMANRLETLRNKRGKVGHPRKASPPKGPHARPARRVILKQAQPGTPVQPRESQSASVPRPPLTVIKIIFGLITAILRAASSSFLLLASMLLTAVAVVALVGLPRLRYHRCLLPPALPPPTPESRPALSPPPPVTAPAYSPAHSQSSTHFLSFSG